MEPPTLPSPSPPPATPSPPLMGAGWWASMGSPTRISAPMVDGSALPFRMLVRRYGAQLAFTPMLHAKMMVTSPSYCRDYFTTAPGDRPLIAQLAGHDPATVLAAAKMVESRVDGVDLNLGCPQGIARRGKYGAFLLEDTPTVVAVVSALAQGLTVPVSVKIRARATREDTLATVLAVQTAGASLITLHGRTRTNMKQSITGVDWELIKWVKEHPEVRIPIVANGGVGCAEDVQSCLAVTGADGVMSSEALLECPGLFSGCVRADGTTASQFDLAREYLEFAVSHGPTAPGTAKSHLMKMLFAAWMTWTDLRATLSGCKDLGKMRELVDAAEARFKAAPAPPAPSPADLQAWAQRRAAEPTIGLPHPAYVGNPGVAGSWYMRYRGGTPRHDAKRALAGEGGEPPSKRVAGDDRGEEGEEPVVEEPVVEDPVVVECVVVEAPAVPASHHHPLN